MLSIQKRFLFVHVPKTGGNSIQGHLRHFSEDVVHQDAWQDGINQFHLMTPGTGLIKHSPLSAYRDALDPEVYASLFRFSVIRDPWDRMISFYFSPHRRVTEWDRDAFKAFVRTREPLRHYIREDEGLGAVAAQAGPAGLADDLHALIRFEHLHADFKAVCERLDIPPVELPVRNRSQRRPYRDYYDGELRALVAARFADEVAYGGYVFGGASPRAEDGVDLLASAPAQGPIARDQRLG